jgi:hypothetical protein
MDPALLAIEVQPRYRDLLSGHWPVVARPEPEELLSSWLHRLAFGNGVPPKAFGPALDLGSGAWSGRLDLALPEIVRDRLVRHTALTPGAVGGMTLAGFGARTLVLPLRADLSPGRRGRRQAAWLQFCPQCLAEDGQPYFRREWRLATTIACARHGSRLLDRCPACGQGLAPFNQASLRPQNDCAACGFDLASAKAPRLGAGARRAAANLADLGRRVTDANSAVVDAILALPAKLDPLRAAALTALPTSDRARALPALASDIDRLCAAATNGTTNRKRCVETTPAPQASLPALLAAYAAVCQRRRILRDRRGPARSSS